MKKLFMVSLLAASLLASCGGDETKEPNWATGISFSETEIVLKEGESKTVEYTVTPADYNHGEVQLSGGTNIYNEHVFTYSATGNKVTITAGEIGEAYLTASIMGKDKTFSASLKVKVRKNLVYPTSVTIANPLTIEYNPEASEWYSVPVSLAPANAAFECLKPMCEYTGKEAFFSVTANPTTKTFDFMPVNHLDKDGLVNVYVLEDPENPDSMDKDHPIASITVKFVAKK